MAPSRRLLMGACGLAAVVAGSLSLCACSTPGSPTSADLTACVSLDNMANGDYIHDTHVVKQQAGQLLIEQAEAASNAALVAEGHRLQGDGSTSSIVNDLARMAKTCDSMGVGPQSTGIS